MSLIFEERSSDSPYLESVTRGRTLSVGSPIRPAEVHWHMVIMRADGRVRSLVVGPWTMAGVTTYGKGAEILWIKFKLGTFMPHLPTRKFRDSETILPSASSQSFWLNSSAWQFPNYDNVETFVDRLARDDLLVRDPVVINALNDRPQDIATRTLRHRFLRATGLAQSHIRQAERARQAETMLRQGASILDTIYEAGYFDQPHLTRSMNRFVGFTPAQIVRSVDTDS